MWCPRCEGEYRPGIDVCPTCEVALVEDLSDRPPERPGPMPARLASALVDLIGFVDEAEARRARAALKAGGMPCELVIRDAFGPGKSADEEEYWIRVPATSASDAVVVLGNAGLGNAMTPELPRELSEDHCPSCGALLAPDEDCPRCLGEA